MTKVNNCLTKEALEKCNCKDCQEFRLVRTMMLKHYAQQQILDIYTETFKNESSNIRES